MSNFDAGKIVKKLQKEFGIMPTEKSQSYNRKLIRELNAKHREVLQVEFDENYDYRRKAIARFEEEWRNRITGIYILLEEARTYEDDKEISLTAALSRVRTWVNESLPEGDRR